MAEEKLQKWEGKVMVELKGFTPEQIWPFLEDFCNVDKIFPNIDTCYRVEGTLGEPGLVRYCEGKSAWANEKHGKLTWANEKLLIIDPTNHSLSYEFLENSVGMKNYVATLKVLPIMEGDGKPAAGCKIEWSFIADPCEGLGLDDFVSYINNILQFMAKKMEDAIIKAQNLESEI